MYELLIFSAAEAGYKYHHTVDLEFDNPQSVMLAAAEVLKQMHNLFNEPIELMKIENKSVIVEEEEKHGCMMTSANIPWSCFVPELEVDGDPITYTASLPKHSRITQVPEC